jgi:hypothetical protein
LFVEVCSEHLSVRRKRDTAAFTASTDGNATSGGGVDAELSVFVRFQNGLPFPGLVVEPTASALLCSRCLLLAFAHVYILAFHLIIFRADRLFILLIAHLSLIW